MLQKIFKQKNKRINTYRSFSSGLDTILSDVIVTGGLTLIVIGAAFTCFAFNRAGASTNIYREHIDTLIEASPDCKRNLASMLPPVHNGEEFLKVATTRQDHIGFMKDLEGLFSHPKATFNLPEGVDSKLTLYKGILETCGDMLAHKECLVVVGVGTLVVSTLLAIYVIIEYFPWEKSKTYIYKTYHSFKFYIIAR